MDVDDTGETGAGDAGDASNVDVDETGDAGGLDAGEAGSVIETACAGGVAAVARVSSSRARETLDGIRSVFVRRCPRRAYVFSNFILTCGYFLANFERLILGCIEADFCK